MKWPCRTVTTTDDEGRTWVRDVVITQREWDDLVAENERLRAEVKQLQATIAHAVAELDAELPEDR